MTPFYLDDLEGLRAKLVRAEREGALAGRVWAALRRRARSSPEGFPWFLPFTALVTGEERDVEPARNVIRAYVRTMDRLQLTSGLHFHFWCFAFPHARYALYFQWLDALGAWTRDEAQAIRERLIEFQYVNFFFGMRTKPEPECVDNQTMSLCFSNALIGRLFGQGEGASAMAARMGEDGMRRLPSMLGGMPPGGYSGEGSTYMDHVVGPCVPFVVELLERSDGASWFSRALPPDGGSAASIVRMIAREWTPSGLTLPWDHYGYALPVRSCIAYGARKTGDPFYIELLERHANWTHDVQVGWGYDDLVWTLVWWPDRRPEGRAALFPSWAEPDVGGALVSDDARLYLMQMWDPTNPGSPSRAHFNPNALVLCAHGAPLTTDGVPAKDCTALHFEGTWREVGGSNFHRIRYSFGPGCAGAHGVLFVDGWEGLHARAAYPQARLLEFDAPGKSVTADVTPLYREHWPDAKAVRRRSRLCAERFWLVEDLAAFDRPHRVTSRWFFRPSVSRRERGVLVDTAEGVRLDWIALVGPDDPTIGTIEGFPERLERRSDRVDFTQEGAVCRWLWLGWPDQTRTVAADWSEGWQALPDPGGDLGTDAVRRRIESCGRVLPFTAPPFMLAEMPVAARWWYRKRVRVPDGDRKWIRLPAGMRDARLWVNGGELDLSPWVPSQDLIPPHVPLAESIRGEAEIMVRTDCGTAQYAPGGTSGFSGAPALILPRPVEPLREAFFREGAVTVRAGDREWTVPHALMEVS
jgi:hypothetical protein